MGKKNLVNFKQASNHFMPLTVFDRLVLLQLLPQEGNYLTLKIMGDLGKDLSFSEEEHAQLNFVQGPESITWNTEANIIKDVQVGPKAREMIATSLKSMDATGKLKPVHLALYEEFVGKE